MNQCLLQGGSQEEEPEEHIWCFILEQCPTSCVLPSAPLKSDSGDVALTPFSSLGLGRSGIIPAIFPQCGDSMQNPLEGPFRASCGAVLGRWGEAGRPGRGHVQGSVGSCPRTSQKSPLSPLNTFCTRPKM